MEEEVASNERGQGDRLERSGSDDTEGLMGRETVIESLKVEGLALMAQVQRERERARARAREREREREGRDLWSVNDQRTWHWL